LLSETHKRKSELAEEFAKADTTIQNYLRARPDQKSPKPANASILIKTFGVFQIQIGERLLTKDDWQRKKARDVFKYLLIHHKKAVTTEELADALWQTSASDAATAMKTVISQIRKALEPTLSAYQPSAYLKSQDHAYRLEFGSDAEIDFITFKKCLEEAAQKNGDEKRTMLELAIGLYSGEFLKEDSFEEWSTATREQLKDSYLTAVTTLAKLYRDAGERERALRLLNTSLETDRIYEPVLDLLFELLHAEKRTADLRKLYDECLLHYKKELSAKPPEKFRKFLI
jgi:LuxR family transcriptional regulator, maltose regulon positive regulatory protein